MAPAKSSAVASGTLPANQDAAHSKGQQEDYHQWDHVEGFFDLDPKEVHPFHAAAKPSQEALKESVAAPVIVTPNPMVKEQVCVSVLLKHVLARFRLHSAVKRGSIALSRASLCPLPSLMSAALRPSHCLCHSIAC